MVSWEQAVVFAVTMLGAVLGGLLGYAKSDAPFNWKSFVVTVGTGVAAGAGWLALVSWQEATFGIPILVEGVFAAMGFDFAAKKTILTKLV